nr:hypothetical protein [Paenibacillus sp. SYP-B3998]
MGFTTYLVADVKAMFDRAGPDGVVYAEEQVHCMTPVNVHEKFATIASAEEIMEWLSSV